MAKLSVKASSLSGQITIPSSKSHTMRAILFASLAKGKSVITTPLVSPDTSAMIHACQLLGATIYQSDQKLEIIGMNGHLSPPSTVIYAGNSGIILRFCSALAALSSHPIIITGDHSIRTQRSMHPLLEGLRQLGVAAISLPGNEYAPLIIQGPIRKASVCIQGQDSQFVSGLLIALAFNSHPVALEVINPGEKPWVGMTLSWFDKLGITYSNQDFHSYHMQGNTSYEGFSYQVPGDFSSAAFPIAAALITHSEIKIENLDMQDCQGDKELISIFIKMGASIDYDEKAQVLYVKKKGALKGLEIDVNNFIDAIPILAVLACFAEGKTVLKNAKIARQKECDRLHVMCKELSKMGAQINENEEGLTIERCSLKGAALLCHQDHRVAMALAIAGLGASGITHIDGAECMVKTYKDFVPHFNSLGAEVKWKE